MESGRRLDAYKSRGPSRDIRRLLKAKDETKRRKLERDETVMRRRHAALREIQEEVSGTTKSSKEMNKTETAEAVRLRERLQQWKASRQVEKEKKAMDRKKHRPFVVVARSNVIPRTPPALPQASKRKFYAEPVILRRSTRLAAKESSRSGAQSLAKTVRGKERSQKVSKNREEKTIKLTTTQCAISSKTKETEPVPQSFVSQLESTLNTVSVVDFSKPFSPFHFSFQPSNKDVAAVNPYKETIGCHQEISESAASKLVTVRAVNSDCGSTSSPWSEVVINDDEDAQEWWKSDLKEGNSGNKENAAELKDDASSDDVVSNWVDTKRLAVAPFRQLIESETQRLQSLCDTWNQIVAEKDEQEDDDVVGMINAAVGKAQLLIRQRFHQFSQLCDLAEDPSAVKTAEVSDLQGFWDMISCQVTDINSQFEQLSQLQANHWQIEEKKIVRKQGKRRAKKKKVEAASATDTTRRLHLRQFKAKMMAAKKPNNDDLPFEMTCASGTAVDVSDANANKTSTSNLKQLVTTDISTPPALAPNFDMLNYIPSRQERVETRQEVSDSSTGEDSHTSKEQSSSVSSDQKLNNENYSDAPEQTAAAQQTMMCASGTAVDVSETNTNKTPTTNLKKNGKPYSLRSSILKSATKHNVSEQRVTTDMSTPPALAPNFDMLDYISSRQERFETRQEVSDSSTGEDGHTSKQQSSSVSSDQNLNNENYSDEEAVCELLAEFTLNHRQSAGVDVRRDRSSLMTFTPSTLKEEDQMTDLQGLVRKFAEVTPSKQLRDELGIESCFTPVLRSARNFRHYGDQTVVDDLQDLPYDYNYLPNKSLN
ncbi:disks large-associated protein 5-like isoform X2 [Corticium candelabrum]|uniref:disks large-associated protein 5-like isoform X2 n=1 Tax=Corticium candelabrum TaxID=121492 RepID=UPI002E26612D|nr:disks large-associated protein 5-like isoform X2 [Corticium candelabrum]